MTTWERSAADIEDVNEITPRRVMKIIESTNDRARSTTT